MEKKVKLQEEGELDGLCKQFLPINASSILNVQVQIFLKRIFMKFHLLDVALKKAKASKESSLYQIHFDKVLLYPLNPIKRKRGKLKEVLKGDSYVALHKQFEGFFKRIEEPLTALKNLQSRKEFFFSIFVRSKFSVWLWDVLEECFTSKEPLELIKALISEVHLQRGMNLSIFQKFSEELSRQYDRVSYYRYARIFRHLDSKMKTNRPNLTRGKIRTRKNIKELERFRNRLVDLLTEELTQEGYSTEKLTAGELNKQIILLAEIKRLKKIIQQKNENELILKMHLYEEKLKLRALQKERDELKHSLMDLNQRFKFNEAKLLSYLKINPISRNLILNRYQETSLAMFKANNETRDLVRLSQDEVDQRTKLEGKESSIESFCCNIKSPTRGDSRESFLGRCLDSPKLEKFYKISWFKESLELITPSPQDQDTQNLLSKFKRTMCIVWRDKNVLADALYLINEDTRTFEKIGLCQFGDEVHSEKFILYRAHNPLRLNHIFLVASPEFRFGYYLGHEVPVDFTVVGRGIAVINMSLFVVLFTGSVELAKTFPDDDPVASVSLALFQNQVLDFLAFSENKQKIEISLDSPKLIETLQSGEHQRKNLTLKLWFWVPDVGLTEAPPGILDCVLFLARDPNITKHRGRMQIEVSVMHIPENSARRYMDPLFSRKSESKGFFLSDESL